MSTGVVKWFNPSIGYGYITTFNGEEIYFHFESIRERGRAYATGTRVDFDLIETRIGFEATNVRCAA